MEEILEQGTTQEPVSDNSEEVSQTQEGQAENAPSELILGKFKSVDELTKAYEKLEKFQGLQSQELGRLRQQNNEINDITKIWQSQKDIEAAKEALETISQKYNTPEYFQDQAFREMYKEAYKALGNNLDADRFVNLIENYVTSRIYALEKTKSAQSETEKAIGTMSFSQNKTNSITPPRKRLDEMTPKEVDALLERLI